MSARPEFIARDVDVVPAASLIAEPTRAAMITALLDDRPLAAGELARLAGVSPATASAHLARLLNGGLVKMIKQGRQGRGRAARSPAGPGDPGARPGWRPAVERGPVRGGRPRGERCHGRRWARVPRPPARGRAAGADPPRSLRGHAGRGCHADIVRPEYRCAGAGPPPLRRRLPG